MAAAAVQQLPYNDLFPKDNPTGGLKRKMEEKFEIPDFQHAYTKRPLHPLAAQYADEVHNFVASHGVAELIGPELWSALVRATAPDLMGYVSFDAEPRDFMWISKYVVLLFAMDGWVDEGDYKNNPEKSLDIVLGMTLALMWNNPEDKRLLEHVKPLYEDCITTDESRALLKTFHEDLVHAKNKTKDRESEPT